MSCVHARSGARYTEAELKRAIFLHDEKGLAWSIIGERLGRSAESLKVTVWRYRRGRIKFSFEAWRAESEEIAQLAFCGLSISEIARRRGCAKSNIWQRLSRIGVDQEAIHQVRNDRKRAA